jgi:hypothetical protein
VLGVNPVLECVNTPVDVPPSAIQFVGPPVETQVPRDIRVAGIPRKVTFAPTVAEVEVIEVAVGVVTIGTVGGGNVVNVTLAP